MQRIDVGSAGARVSTAPALRGKKVGELRLGSAPNTPLALRLPSRWRDPRAITLLRHGSLRASSSIRHGGDSSPSPEYRYRRPTSASPSAGRVNSAHCLAMPTSPSTPGRPGSSGPSGAASASLGTPGSLAPPAPPSTPPRVSRPLANVARGNEGPSSAADSELADLHHERAIDSRPHRIGRCAARIQGRCRSPRRLTVAVDDVQLPAVFGHPQYPAARRQHPRRGQHGHRRAGPDARARTLASGHAWGTCASPEMAETADLQRFWMGPPGLEPASDGL